MAIECLSIFGLARKMLEIMGYQVLLSDLKTPRSGASEALVWMLSFPWEFYAFLFVGITFFLGVMLVLSLRPQFSEAKNQPAPVLNGVEPKQPNPQDLNPLETYFSKKVIRIADLVQGGEYLIKDKIFEDCYIYGPEVIALIDRMTMDSCSFNGDMDSTFIEVLPNRRVIGAIGFTGGTFKRCKFVGVGIIGTKEQITHFVNGFKAA
jgi:hypothetical protein